MVVALHHVDRRGSTPTLKTLPEHMLCLVLTFNL